MASKSIATKAIDFARLSATLKLKQDTIASLNAFRKRHEELSRLVSSLEEQRQTIDFNQYRSILRNKKVVDEAEAAYNSFKPQTYDTSAHVKVIEAYERKAIERAEQTANAVNDQLKELRETLKNIENARPLEQLTVEDVVRARPDIEQEVERRVKLGRWEVDEYNEKFGDARVV